MSSLVRQLKLHTLVGEKASTDPRVGLILTFFAELFDGMEYSVIPEYHKENIIFHKGDRFYMVQDYLNDRLWCVYGGFWSYLQNKMGLQYRKNELESIIKYMMEKHLKQHIGTPTSLITHDNSRVVKFLKQWVGTHDIVMSTDNLTLEDQNKQLYP